MVGGGSGEGGGCVCCVCVCVCVRACLSNCLRFSHLSTAEMQSWKLAMYRRSLAALRAPSTPSADSTPPSLAAVTSSPAVKARSPAPDSTTARTSGSDDSCSNTRRSSCHMASKKALSLAGRLISTCATIAAGDVTTKCWYPAYPASFCACAAIFFSLARSLGRIFFYPLCACGGAWRKSGCVIQRLAGRQCRGSTAQLRELRGRREEGAEGGGTTRGW